jgi:hypothetical protein
VCSPRLSINAGKLNGLFDVIEQCGLCLIPARIVGNVKSQGPRSFFDQATPGNGPQSGYQIQQLDGFEGGYYPSGWGQESEQQLPMRLA